MWNENVIKCIKDGMANKKYSYVLIKLLENELLVVWELVSLLRVQYIPYMVTRAQIPQSIYVNNKCTCCSKHQ